MSGSDEASASSLARTSGHVAWCRIRRLEHPRHEDGFALTDSFRCWARLASGLCQANTGGVSFEITPSTTEVFIDGSFVGTVGEFTPTTQPLGLTPGRHRIEIRAPGIGRWMSRPTSWPAKSSRISTHCSAEA
jgi:hypothetical protein